MINETAKKYISQLETQHSLSIDEYTFLIKAYTPGLAAYASEKAVAHRKEIYGTNVYIRGLIEISNYCKNNCLYCGIRRSNRDCVRYRLTPKQILECCAEGYALGFRTFVLQGGEDAYFSDKVVCQIVSDIKTTYPDCAVTLSLGEKSYESYAVLFAAGADRYLLRHETAVKEHYEKLHPTALSWEHRMQCLYDLKSIGYQVGCGFMVGSPYQTNEMLAHDLKFIEEFQPHMCGIGPFIPHHATPFANEPAGTVELTAYLLSLIRLIKPNILLPATTALGTLHSEGREMGILAGANVVMPNLSPVSERKKYELYDNKAYTGDESAQSMQCMKEKMKSIGYDIVVSRGDIKLNSRD